MIILPIYDRSVLENLVLRNLPSNGLLLIIIVRNDTLDDITFLYVEKSRHTTQMIFSWASNIS